MNIDMGRMRAIAALTDHRYKVYEAAKYYAGQGIPVIPIPPGKKYVSDKNLYTARCTTKLNRIEEWFSPLDGPHAGWNIALGCGDYYGKGGIFVIDVDTKYAEKYGTKVWGIEAWDELKGAYGEMYGPVSQTPSDGLHVFARWAENLTPSQNKIALGIDTRGGHPSKISSHVMAFPSIVDGIEYKWMEGGDIVHAPAWISERMGTAWQAKATGTGPGRGSELVDESDLEDRISLTKVESMLEGLNPNDLDYNEWLRIGQAIHSQHNTKEGLELWDTWSQRGSKYEMGECTVRWKGFKEGGPVRMATLMYICQNLGVASKVDINDGGSDEGALTDVIDEYNQQYALVLSGENAKVVRKEVDINYGQYRYSTYKIEAFKSFLHNDVMLIEDAKGVPKSIKKFDVWMASQRRRTFDGMVMRPDKDSVIQLGNHQYLNTWAGFTVEPVPGSWSLLKHHTFKYLCCENELHFEWLMDWMADLVQDPANPKGCAVILGGVEGAGKGTLANAIAHLFGIHASIIQNSDHLTSKFNDMITDSVFLFADEVVYAGNHEAANRLKGMVTEAFTTREKKFGDKGLVRSFIHVMMATNNDWKVAAGPESRRWFILQVNPDTANDAGYFGAIKKEMNEGGYEAMLHELLNREITVNLRFAPVTDELKKQRSLMSVNSQNESFPAWCAHLSMTGTMGVPDLEAEMDNSANPWPLVLAKADIWESYAEWVRKYRPKATVLAMPTFYTKLYEMGFKNGPRKAINRARVYTIKAPTLEEFCQSAEKIYAIQISDHEEVEDESAE